MKGGWKKFDIDIDDDGNINEEMKSWILQRRAERPLPRDLHVRRGHARLDVPRAALPHARPRRPHDGPLREARQDVGRGGESWGGGRRVMDPSPNSQPPPLATKHASSAITTTGL